MSTFARGVAIVVAPVDLLELPAWERGPLPVAKDGVVASAELRRGYFNERSASTLYGPGRLHREMGSEHGLGQFYNRFEVAGVDLLRGPAARRAPRAGCLREEQSMGDEKAPMWASGS
jgi:hypothetical protein